MKAALRLAAGISVAVAFVVANASFAQASCTPFDPSTYTSSTSDQLANGSSCFHAESYDHARDWWQAAAQRDSASAKFNLGLLYDNGLGVHENDFAATDWFKQAADHGVPEAQYNLSIRLSQGIGTQKDEQAALEYLYAAADQGLRQAHYDLATRYYRGNGVPLSYFQSYVWLQVAHASATASGLDLPHYRALVTSLSQGLTAADIQQAKVMARAISAPWGD